MNNVPFTLSQVRPIRDAMTVSRPSGLGYGVPVTWFSLGAGTSITPEYYDCTTLYLGGEGNGKFLLGVDGQEVSVKPGEVLYVPPKTLCGTKTDSGTIYTEIILKKENFTMNNIIKAGQPTELKELISYEEGSIANLDIAHGNQISICRFCPGEVFGAELACTGWTVSPVCLRASSGCTVMQLDFSALMSQKTLTCPCRMQVTANLMQDMAQQLLFFNTKVRILAQKRLRDRLKIYLQTLTPDEKGCYSLPYTRTELADFLCVDRSALSRELCRMRDERILDFSGAKIHLLNPTFLYGWN